MTEPAPQDLEFLNSLGDLACQLNQTPYGPSEQISQTDTMSLNCRWYLVSNFRQLLSQIYVEHGLIQTLIDQPVDDGFRPGFEIKSGELDADDFEKAMIFCERHRVIDNIMQAIKWARLYGGGALLILTDQDPMFPLDIKAINEKTPLEFRAVDMWELYNSEQNVEGDITPGGALGMGDAEYYDYYGKRVHHSRVFRIKGKEPPSFIRPRLRGWGMSEVERVVRSLNQYLKNQDVIFALLDEAKIDVYKIKGFNAALLNRTGTAGIAKRIQGANLIKNYNHALTMDAEDDYIQKTMTFAGLSDILLQIRQGIAGDLKIPMTKLFGISAAGFSSGEDDIENYNAMIDSEIRAKSKFIIVDVLAIVCQKLFGFAPDDLMVSFNPLRILNAIEEEEVKNHQYNRLASAFQLGLMDGQEAKEGLNKDSLISIEVDETTDALPPLGENLLTPSGDKVDGKS